MHSLFDRKFNPITIRKEHTLTAPALLAQSNTKKQVAYNRWVNRYGEILYRYAYWILRDTEQAAGITQRTFTNVWARFDEISAGKNPKIRLFGLMYGELGNNTPNNQSTWNISTQPISNSTAKIRETGDHEVDKSIAKISITAIPSQQLKLMGLQLLGGFSDAEISLISGLTQTAVRSEITAAKLHLLDDQKL